jgi:class 3 adenylate cyclase
MAEAPDGAAPGLLTRAQVLALSGCSEAELARCEEFGIVSADAGGFRGLELLKLQLLRQVSAHAGGFDHLLRRYQEGGYSLNWIRLCLPQTMDVTGVTVGQALEEVGVPLEEVAQVARADEIEMFRQYAVIRTLPVPLETRVHVVRIAAEGARRTAEAQSEAFRRFIVEPMLETHKADLPRANNLLAEISAAAHPTMTAINSWIYQRQMEHEIIKTITERMEEAASGGQMAQRARDPVVMFCDLSGFTFVSAEAGDDEAAHLAGRFSDSIVDLTRVHRGRVIKMLGDGAMLFFDDGENAVRAALELTRSLPAAGLPPARVGVNRGPVVAQSGDFYGTTINVAARINDYARPHEVLVSDTVLPDGAEGINLEEIGPVTLKGVPRPVRLYRARDWG